MADFRERNLKITLRFALRFLKVRPRHWGLSPRLPRATWVCPQGYLQPQGLSPQVRTRGLPQWCKPRFRGLSPRLCPQGYAGACPPLILSVVPF